MRRAISSVVLSLMLIVIVGTTVGAADVTFSAEGGTGPAGGDLPVTATVHNAAPGTTFTAVAVVHFGGDVVTVEFGSEAAVTTALMARSHDREHPKKDKKDKHHRKHHKHHKHPKHPTDPDPVPGVELTASTLVPISGETNWGPVDIEVTITYGGAVVTVTTTGLVDGYSE